MIKRVKLAEVQVFYGRWAAHSSIGVVVMAVIVTPAPESTHQSEPELP
jgi:hypothetical protein